MSLQLLWTVRWESVGEADADVTAVIRFCSKQQIHLISESKLDRKHKCKDRGALV